MYAPSELGADGVLFCLNEASCMPTDHSKPKKGTAHTGPSTAPRKPAVELPKPIDQLERTAHQELVPRLESIIRVLLDSDGEITVRRGDAANYPGEILIDLVFGRQPVRSGGWTAYLIRIELDPASNEVSVQAGLNLHLNRKFAYGEKDWDDKLIEGFDWLLSDSMRGHLRISG
jgi:hypothetical protein